MASELDKRLRALRNAASWRLVLGGAACATAAVLSIALIGAVADFRVELEHGQRALLLWAGLALGALVALWLGVRPWLRARSVESWARRVDRRWPELQGGALATWHLSDGLRRQTLSGSLELAEAALRRLDEGAETVDLGVVVPRRSLRVGLVLAATSAFAVLLLWLVHSEIGTVAFARLVMLRDLGYPRTTHVTAWEPPADAKLRAGDDNRIVAVASGVLPESGRCEMQDGDDVFAVPLLRTGDRFVAEFPQLAGSRVRMRVHVGDATTDWRSVTMLQQPRLATRLSIEEPGRERREIAAGDTAVAEGSVLRVEATASKPLRKAGIETDPPRALALAVRGDVVTSAPIQLEESLRIRLTAEDEDGMQPDRSPWIRIRVRPDREPTVAWSGTITELLMLPSGRVTADYRIRDDLGIAKSTVHTTVRSGGTSRALEAPTDRHGEREIDDRMDLDLGSLAVVAGDVLSIRVAAADNRVIGPQSASSDPLQVRIVDRVALLTEVGQRMATLAERRLRPLRRRQEVQLDQLGGALAGADRPEESRSARFVRLHGEQQAIERALADIRTEVEQVTSWLTANGVQNEADTEFVRDVGNLLAAIEREASPAARVPLRLLEGGDRGAGPRAVELTEHVVVQLRLAEKLAAPMAGLDSLVEELLALLRAHEAAQRESFVLQRLKLRDRVVISVEFAQSLRALALREEGVIRGWREFAQRLAIEGDGPAHPDVQKAAAHARELAVEADLSYVAIELGSGDPGTAITVSRIQELVRTELVALLRLLVGESSLKARVGAELERRLQELRETAADATTHDADGAFALAERLRVDRDLAPLLGGETDGAKAAMHELEMLQRGDESDADLTRGRWDRVADDLEPASSAPVTDAATRLEHARELDALAAAESPGREAEVGRMRERVVDENPELAKALESLPTNERDPAEQLRELARREAGEAAGQLQERERKLELAEKVQNELAQRSRSEPKPSAETRAERQSEQRRLEQLAKSQEAGNEDAQRAAEHNARAEQTDDPQQAAQQHQQAAQQLREAREKVGKLRRQAEGAAMALDAQVAKGGQSEKSGSGAGNDADTGKPGTGRGAGKGQGEGEGEGQGSGGFGGSPGGSKPTSTTGNPGLAEPLDGAPAAFALPDWFEKELRSSGVQRMPRGYEERFRRYYRTLR